MPAWTWQGCTAEGKPVASARYATDAAMSEPVARKTARLLRLKWHCPMVRFWPKGMEAFPYTDVD